MRVPQESISAEKYKEVLGDSASCVEKTSNYLKIVTIFVLFGAFSSIFRHFGSPLLPASERGPGGSALCRWLRLLAHDTPNH